MICTFPPTMSVKQLPWYVLWYKLYVHLLTPCLSNNYLGTYYDIIIAQFLPPCLWNSYLGTYYDIIIYPSPHTMSDLLTPCLSNSYLGTYYDIIICPSPLTMSDLLTPCLSNNYLDTYYDIIICPSPLTMSVKQLPWYVLWYNNVHSSSHHVSQTNTLVRIMI